MKHNLGLMIYPATNGGGGGEDMIFAFIIIRILDLHSTYLSVSKWGTSVEGVSVSRYFMSNLNYSWFVALNLGASLLLYFLLCKIRLGKVAIKVFMALNLMVVVSNYYLATL